MTGTDKSNTRDLGLISSGAFGRSERRHRPASSPRSRADGTVDAGTLDAGTLDTGTLDTGTLDAGTGTLAPDRLVHA